jgi:hypothetical protein
MRFFYVAQDLWDTFLEHLPTAVWSVVHASNLICEKAKSMVWQHGSAPRIFCCCCVRIPPSSYMYSCALKKAQKAAALNRQKKKATQTRK